MKAAHWFLQISFTMRLVQNLLVVASLASFGCTDANEYSPNQTEDADSPRELTKQNLARLAALPADDTLTIAFAGDSQNFYDEVESFVQEVNQHREVDLVLVAGDISDFGLLQEFEWITDRLGKLDQPYIAVIGNHDVVGNGEAVYKKMFGALDFSFVYDSTKFIIHNTNSREYRSGNVPDMAWLAEELKTGEGIQRIIAVSHVPPFDGDFDRDLEGAYSRLFASTPRFLLSLHGHIHRHTDGFPYDDGIRYITSHVFEEQSFVKLKIWSDNIEKTIVPY
jgi:3',5'-cyclic-AMP phosphodiesterase